MLLLARRNLFSERIRFIISVGGVALSVFLIGMLVSLYRGWDEKVGSFVEESDVDLWVATVGTNDFLLAGSVIPLDGAELAFQEQTDVEEWSPIIVRPLLALGVEIKGDGERGTEKEVDLQLIGYDPATGISGPLKVIEGKSEPGPDEVIIDEAVTKRYGIGMGDVLSAGGQDWKIVGISTGGDFVAAQTAFIRLVDAQDALQMPNFATFIGIRLAPTANAEDLKTRITTGVPGIDAFTKQEFADATRERVLGNVLPILLIVLILAFVVGLAVAGLTIYTSTIEKAREYGILKAVGFRNSYLYRLVFEQSMATGAIGFAIGLGLTLIFGPLASNLVPQFVTLVRVQDVGAIFVATVVMSAVAGYVPVRKLAAIDPTSVFKA